MTVMSLYAVRLRTKMGKLEQLIFPGRISSFRIAGSKLLFLDIIQNNYKVQGVCELSNLGQNTSIDDFSKFYHMLRRGDHLS